MDAPVWDATVFTKSRQRLLAGDVAVSFLLTIIGDPAVKQLLSTEHSSGGRHAVRRLGVDEEFSTQGRSG